MISVYNNDAVLYTLSSCIGSALDSCVECQHLAQLSLMVLFPCVILVFAALIYTVKLELRGYFPVKCGG